ncbi:cytochrome P450 [Bisporella sp. PMI_857]|nr:cytochrome P450 [Bisporella sp. PMI_857]
MTASNLLSTFCVLLATCVSYAVFVTYRHRSKINKLRNQGYPNPPGWNWITGHLLVLLRYTKPLPPLANVAIVIRELCREFADTEMFLLDMWPAFPPAIITFNPESTTVISQKYNLPKPKASLDTVKPIVGGHSLLSMNGSEWKTWRSRFNQGFSAASLNEHVPYIVDCVEIFCDKLRTSAENGIFSLDDFTTRLTFDVIMKVSLDSDINYQSSKHVLPSALKHIIHWHSTWDPRVLIHPLRPLIQAYYDVIVKNYIRKELELRFTELKEQKISSRTVKSVRKPNSSIALALEAFFNERKDTDISTMEKLDDEFADILSNQIRLFLFAGNDTTSSTMVFTQHLLFKHPEVLSELKYEHDNIFGSETPNAARLLKEQPALINQCKYTLAVVKEVMRIYPPSTNMRQGVPGVSISSLDGQSMSTDGLLVIVNHPAFHQNPRVWTRAEEFIPERWLVESDHELYPPKDAYRPFDIGSRACIGQNLSLIEMRIVLIMTARTFDFKPAYDEWDRIQALNESIWSKMRRSIFGREINTVRGDRAYPNDQAGTHPSDGYPCRVSIVG